MSTLVSTQWLDENLDDVKVVDGSWRMPGTENASVDFKRRYIPGAIHFDIDHLADHSVDLPHMAPSPAEFADAVAALGLSSSDTIVVYDDVDLFSGPRVWWTFLLMGHQEVLVLDGGLQKWIDEGRTLSSEVASGPRGNFHAEFQASRIADHHDIRQALSDPGTQIIDARPAARFVGLAKEPRAGLRCGAMPGALNVPFDTLLNEGKNLKARDDLRHIFHQSGVDLERSLITSCGSGVTAAIIGLALETLGHSDWRLYDGSWAEWGKENHDSVAYPVVATG